MSDASETAPAKKRGGRIGKGKSGTFTFRVTASLREKLQADAEAVGRPVSEIIEYHLSRSYEREQEASNPYIQDIVQSARLAASAAFLKVGPWPKGSLTARYVAETLALELANSLWLTPVDQIESEDEREKARVCLDIARDDFASELDKRKKMNAGIFERLLQMTAPGEPLPPNPLNPDA